MKKLDLKKELKALYKTSATEVCRVSVPAAKYLMIDGRGDPNTSAAYAAAVEALFAVSYTLKFAVKKGPLAIDYGVMPLEGLWWADDMAVFSTTSKADWRWTMMIRQPPFVTPDMAARALDDVRKKKNLAAVERVRFDRLEEGDCLQIMHVGPFSTEGPTVAKLHDAITAAGKVLRGKHHEIYLSDIRRAAPEKWRTIIRQPFGE